MTKPDRQPQIVINNDENCPKCGGPGSVNGGLCLECATDRIVSAHDPIDKAINEAIKLFTNNLDRYRTLIYDAMMADEDHEIALTCPVKISEKGKGIGVEVGIGFAMGKVKDSARSFIDEKQLRLF